MQRSPTCEHCQRNYELKDSQPIGNKIPILLPCGHTFCEGCLLKATKMKSELQCFTCEEQFQLNPSGHKGVKHFVPNIYLLGLILYNKRVALESGTSSLPLSLSGPISSFSGMGKVMRQKNIFPGKFNDDIKEAEIKSQEEAQGGVIFCQECSTRPASCQCAKCHNICFCDKCFRSFHAASKLLSSHSPLPLEYSREVKLTCEVHDGRDLEFYDKNLKEAVCAMCIINEKHRSHEIIALNEMQQDEDLQLNEAYEKAQKTLLWLQSSSKTLVKALPEEIFDCHNLYAEIHAQFTACHTLLLKRQIELNTDVAEKLSASGTVNNMLQEITTKIKEISTALRNFEMVKDNKNIMRLKAEDFVKKFESISDSPCIVERVEDEKITEINYIISDDATDSLEALGSIDVKEGKRFTLKKQSDYTEEVLSGLYEKMTTHEEKVYTVVKSNEILDEEENIPKKKSKLSKLLIGGGTYELVYVTDPGNPNDFKVQRYADKERLEVLMSSLNKYCRQSAGAESLVYKAEEGQLVCAQFTVDNLWYRARVMNTSSPNHPGQLPTIQNNLPIHVTYIDYGNSEWISLNRLRQLKEEFLEVPEMAIPCSLMDIVPPYKEVTWPKNSIRAFHSVTGDRPLLMNIRKRMAGKLYVDLRKPDDDAPTAIDDCRPVSVKDALVFLEVAVFVSPASHPNLDSHRSLRSYLPPIELEKGRLYEIVVTHAENPHHVYIQDRHSIIANEQQHLTKLYSSRGKKQWKCSWPYRNLVVGAKFTVDQTWYRGLIKQVNRDDTVEVEYVDYGNKETLSFEDIRKLPEMFLKVPIQCLKVKLYGMDKPDDAEEFTEMSNLLLKEKFIDQEFYASVRGFDESNIPLIELIDTRNDYDINMNMLLIDQSGLKDLGLIPRPVNNDDIENIGEKTAEDVLLEKNDVSFAKYLAAECPYSKNVSVKGVYVDETANIYLHINDEDNLLSDIMTHLNSGVTFPDPLLSSNQLMVGQACIGKFKDDNLWYRVEISEIIDDKTLLIYFIDFGNHEIIECRDVVAQPYFVDVPAQCLRTRLFGVMEYVNQPNCGWSEEAKTFVINEVVNEDVSFTVKQNIGGIYLGRVTLGDGSDLANLLVAKNLMSNCAPEMIPLPAEIDQNDENSAEVVAADDTTVCQDGYTPATKSSFQKSEIPIDVTVTQIDRPDLIYIQCADNDLLDLLNSISEEINTDGYFDNVPSIASPVEGMPCIAKYTDDEVFYRGRIEKLYMETGMADILFVDYGNSEILPIPSLKPISDHLLNLPIMAAQARLDEIKPPPLEPTEEGSSVQEFVAGTQWLVEHMKKFYSIVADKKMSALIKDSSSVPILIELFDASNLSIENGGGELIPVKVLMQQENIVG